MTYVTRQDLDERFGAAEIAALSDRDHDDVEDPGVVDRALEDADAVINGYLERRYALPLATVPRLIKRLAADVALYHLYDDRVPEAVQKRYDAAIRTLREIGDGEVRLGLDDADKTTADGTVDTLTSAPTPPKVFGRDNMGGY